MSGVKTRPRRNAISLSQEEHRRLLEEIREQEEEEEVRQPEPIPQQEEEEGEPGFFRKAGRYLGGAVKKGAGKVKRYFVNNFNKAVDKRNLHADEFAKMKWYKRALWDIQNPLAALRHDKGTNRDDTLRREYSRINARDRFRAKHSDLPMIQQYEGEGDPHADTKNTAENAVGKMSLGGTVGGLGISLLGDGPRAMYNTPGDVTAAGLNTAMTGNAMAGVGSLLSAGKNTAFGIEDARGGDSAGSAVNFLGAAKDIASAAGSTMSVLAGAGVMTPASALLGGGIASAVGGGLNVGAGLTMMAKAGYRKHQTSKLVDSLAEDEMGDLSEEDAQWAKMLAGNNRLMADADMIQGGIKTAAGALQTTGGILSATALGTLPGTILGGIGTVTDVAGGLLTDKMRGSAKEKYVNKRLGLDDYIREVMEENPKLTERDAKHIVLEAMGVKSGKRSEAYMHLIGTDMEKVQQMRAEDEDTSRGKLGRQFMKSFGLKKNADMKRMLMSQGVSRGDAADLRAAIKKKRKIF